MRLQQRFTNIGLWTIPVSRKPIKGVQFSTRGTKMKTPHLVPLSTQAIFILKQVHTSSGDLDLIFPGVSLKISV